MANENKQFSTSVGVRVQSPAYVRHVRAIWNILGLPAVHGNRQALDLGIRALVKKKGRPEDSDVLQKHLEAMDKS